MSTTFLSYLWSRLSGPLTLWTLQSSPQQFSLSLKYRDCVWMCRLGLDTSVSRPLHSARAEDLCDALCSGKRLLWWGGVRAAPVWGVRMLHILDRDSYSWLKCQSETTHLSNFLFSFLRMWASVSFYSEESIFSCMVVICTRNSQNLGFQRLSPFLLFSGYIQGMSDLLSPLLYVMENEVDAFWCFASYMDQMVSRAIPSSVQTESKSSVY